VSKKLKLALTAALALVFVSSAAYVTIKAMAPKKSPHGFRPPQCTWWVDNRCAQDGWILNFKQDHGRDACLWPTLLVNGTKIPTPKPGCIAAFAPWPGGPVGHVAFVESVDGDAFTISHANYAVGEMSKIFEQVPVRQVKMIAGKNGRARFDGSVMDFEMTFLARE